MGLSVKGDGLSSLLLFLEGVSFDVGLFLLLLKAEVFLSVFVALDRELVHARLARDSFSRTTNQPWDETRCYGFGEWRGEGEGELIETLAHTSTSARTSPCPSVFVRLSLPHSFSVLV